MQNNKDVSYTGQKLSATYFVEDSGIDREVHMAAVLEVNGSTLDYRDTTWVPKRISDEEIVDRVLEWAVLRTGYHDGPISYSGLPLATVNEVRNEFRLKPVLVENTTNPALSVLRPGLTSLLG